MSIINLPISSNVMRDIILPDEDMVKWMEQQDGYEYREYDRTHWVTIPVFKEMIKIFDDISSHNFKTRRRHG